MDEREDSQMRYDAAKWHEIKAAICKRFEEGTLTTEQLEKFVKMSKEDIDKLFKSPGSVTPTTQIGAGRFIIQGAPRR